MSAWLAAFAITQLVEAPIYAWRMGWRRRAWAIALGASCLTHPLIYWGLPRWWSGDWWSYVFAAEAVAVIGEAVWLGLFGVRTPLVWALVANGASVAVGQTVRAIWGGP